MEIAIIICLILLNGIFSMSEVALISSRKFRLENAARKGNSNARAALDLANNPTKFLSTVQLGITLIGILTGIFSGEQITENIKNAILKVPVLAPYASSMAVFVVVILVTFFSIVFGELIPKRIGLLYPETIASVVARPMVLISKVTAPFIWLLTITNKVFLKVLGIKEGTEEKVTEEEIKAIVQQGADGGEIEQIEHNIVARVFALGDRKVTELMTHRTDIVWLDVDATLDDIRQTVTKEHYSVLPVAKESLDRLVGIVNVKNIFSANPTAEGFKLVEFVTKPLVVHDNAAAYQVLEKFRETRQHFAIIADEYGAVLGIITIDDVLDALVGDLSEQSNTEYQIVQREDGSWLADAQYPYFELLNYFGLAGEEGNGDYNTVAGMILDKLGRIPMVGEKLEWNEYDIEIVDLDGLRIDKLIIKKKLED